MVRSHRRLAGQSLQVPRDVTSQEELAPLSDNLRKSVRDLTSVWLDTATTSSAYIPDTRG